MLKMDLALFLNLFRGVMEKYGFVSIYKRPKWQPEFRTWRVPGWPNWKQQDHILSWNIGTARAAVRLSATADHKAAGENQDGEMHHQVPSVFIWALILSFIPVPTSYVHRLTLGWHLGFVLPWYQTMKNPTQNGQEGKQKEGLLLQYQTCLLQIERV